MARILKWGLLGTARINRELIPPLKASRRNVLAAVASRNMERAISYAREWSIPRAYGSYEDLFADPEIDVIYNSLPNSLHAEWTIKAAQAGKHVLCEKPLAISLEEVDAIAAAARQNGVVVQEAFMYRHHPQTIRVQNLIKKGALGKIWLVRGSFSFMIRRTPRAPGPTDPMRNLLDVRLQPDLGGGCVWDLGCYPISYTRMALEAEPEEVDGWWILGPTGVDMHFAGQMRFPQNVVAQFDCSFQSPSRSFMEIIGDESSLFIPNPFKPRGEGTITLRREGGEETLAMPPADLYAGEVENMADAILRGQPTRVSLEDSRKNVAAILALLESARQGKPVRID